MCPLFPPFVRRICQASQRLKRSCSTLNRDGAILASMYRWLPERRRLTTTIMSRVTSYTLYDLPGNATKHQAWSPNVWKIRCVIFILWVGIDYGRDTLAGLYSTTRIYRIRQSGLNSPTSPRLLSASARHTPSYAAAGGPSTPCPSYVTQ